MGVNVEHYQAETPVLDLREYLNGEVEGWGVIHDWKGTVIERFTFSIDGSWEGNKGTLDEVFIYSDGTKENRVWNIQFNDDGTFTGTTDDVIGIAKGKQAGNSVNWKYRFKVNNKGSKIALDMDDWIYMVDENTVINEITMHKWGLKVGRISIAFNKD